MNNEIKEILDRLECDKDDVYYVGYTDGVNIDNTLMPKDIKLLLDYITNLQQENERLDKCAIAIAKIKDLNTMQYLSEENFKYSLNEILKELDNNYE